MRIALVSSNVPFVDGGYKKIVEWLSIELIERGHQVEVIYLPFVEMHDKIFTQYASFQAIDLTDRADLVITFRPPAHMVKHPRKIVWFIHHIRSYYDLWDTELRGFPINEQSLARRALLQRTDTRALVQAYRVFANSRVVADRLDTFNGIRAEVLYPPVSRPDRFNCHSSSDEVLMIARIEEHKRQHLLIEALFHTKTPVRVRLIGTGLNDGYLRRVQDLIQSLPHPEYVSFENKWISEEEKLAAISTCLGNTYFPIDEDSYGYPTLEAALSYKPTLTTTDSGGVREFVIDSENGWVCEPTPEGIAKGLDEMFQGGSKTAYLGKKAQARVSELGIDWDSTIERLLK